MITIGADVEGFVSNAGNIISAIGLIGGSKDEPKLVPLGNLQEDNVLAEFAIDPVTTEDDFVRNITSVVGSLVGKLRQEKLDYIIKPSHFMDATQLKHPKAMQFGCDPDIDAWAGFPNPPPNPRTVGALRTAGGHIHVGFDDSSPFDVVKAMDLFLGVPSILLDNDQHRRKVYGKAGACRLKPYGVEYRVLSNFWIKNEELIRWAYKQTTLAHAFSISENIDNKEKEIVSCINSSDVEAAERLVKEFNITLPKVI